MGQAGISQLHIGAGIGLAVHLHGVVQPEGGGPVEFDFILPPGDAPAGDQASGGLHPLELSGQPDLIAIAADAPSPVAAHLARAAVGVVKQHSVVPAGLRPLHHHQTVRPNGQAALAQPPGQGGKAIRRQPLL